MVGAGACDGTDATPRGTDSRLPTLLNPRPKQELKVRPARKSDAASLVEFRCSRGLDYEEEVEAHIREGALARAALGGDVYRLLLYEDADDRLIAVGAHAPEALGLITGVTIEAVRLLVLGIALEHQGGKLSDGRRISDTVLQHLIADGCRHRRASVATALVDRDNHRSLVICGRNGLTSQIRFSPRYVRVTGRYEVQSARASSRRRGR